MNFLGHAYFTPDDDALLAGNLFGDSVKGRIENLSLPDDLKRGVRFHRFLDSCCNQSSGFQLLKKCIDGEYHLLRGVIADIFIDHLLAVHWDDFSEISLEGFSNQVYHKVKKHHKHFPEPFSRIFARMEKENWLLQNRRLDTIEKIILNVEKRSRYKHSLIPALDDLKLKFPEFEEHFYLFMSEMKILLQTTDDQ